MSTQQQLEYHDIQGIIVSGYAHLAFGAYIFVTLGAPDESRQWLKQVTNDVASAKRWPVDDDGQVIKPTTALFLGLTYEGLKALGLPSRGLNTFPVEFQQGIHDSRRSRILGDSGESAPEHWEIGGEQLHVMLIVLADSETLRDDMVKKYSDVTTEAGASVLGTINAAKLANDREHFGFLDGVSQPKMREEIRNSKASEVELPLGEFVLGYENLYGQLSECPTLDDENIGKNGTYVVFRKLYQDVAAFWKFMEENSHVLRTENQRRSAEERQVLLASKFVGRWPSGAPLTLSPDYDDPDFDKRKLNTFLYRERDPHGEGCPLGSHIRRANPRDSKGASAEESLVTSNRHQIIRRGLSYGKPLLDFDNLPPKSIEDDGEDRGLVFLCLNSSISRQFEFVQQTWLNNTKFHGLYTDKDPVVGDNDGAYTMTIQQNPVRRQVTGIPRFVTVKGGGYFFMPSLSALKRISELS